MWDAQIAELSGRFTVIAYDVRSFGRSAGPGTPYSDHDDLAGLAAPLDPPAIERLGTVQARTLVLAGAHDQQDMLRIADLLARQIPDARKVIVPDAAHLVAVNNTPAS
jgi:pimeloyl-ACP methyl ester carboxylesterase